MLWSSYVKVMGEPGWPVVVLGFRPSLGRCCDGDGYGGFSGGQLPGTMKLDPTRSRMWFA